jgi:hypothetical protein
MEMVIETVQEVNLPEDRVSVNEVFAAVYGAIDQLGKKIVTEIVEAYQDLVVEILCSPSGPVAKKGLGSHEKKDGEGGKCRYRTFTRAGHWSEVRKLRGERFTAEFRPTMIQCKGCGKRLTPVLDALELKDGQGSTDMLLKKAVEAVAETSYRRGSAQLEALTAAPVPKSTAHRWTASVDLPTEEHEADRYLSADGTGFKRQPGRRGEVRLVAGIDQKGRIRPVGVWAGTSWEDISKEVDRRMEGQPELFISDGERAIQEWFDGLAKRTGRCLWHFPRESYHAMWEDDAPSAERQKTRRKLKEIVAIEIPEEDVEMVSEEDKEQIGRKIENAQQEVKKLRDEFEEKGYEKIVTYLDRARDKLFSHLRLWQETGIVGMRTTSIVENIIRELVRRLKKVGWNWSGAGAARMGRIVMIRRHDKKRWEKHWKEQINLRGRCRIELKEFKVRIAA